MKKVWAGGGLLWAVVCSTPALADPATGVWDSECRCFRGVTWGPETWFDGSYRPDGWTFTQSLDFWPVVRGATGQPLILWAHPGNGFKEIEVTRNRALPSLYNKLIIEARRAGFAVGSLDYRHPVQNDDIVPAPHLDVGRAVQSVRAMSVELGIDPRNIFLVGVSQGSLGVWQALQEDLMVPGADGPAGQSSRVNAAYAYNAQVTYRGQETADRFLVPDDRPAYVAQWLVDHPQDALFGSALASVVPDSVPVMLKYEAPYFHRLVSRQELSNHHPDFGLALCEAYAQQGIAERCSVLDQVPKDQDLIGAIPFFLSHFVGTPPRPGLPGTTAPTGAR